jgi:hypothetical protein
MWWFKLGVSFVNMVGVLTACASSTQAPVTASPLSTAPPPAVSEIDHTVTVKWRLADSFDLLPGGRCAGRGDNRGMGDGARIQLQGSSSGFINETRATATVEREELSPKQALIDDGVYCTLRAVFSPSMPDPDGYSVKFSGTKIKMANLGRPGGTRFGRPDPPPGYGVYNVTSQLCPDLLDPPEKDCSD